MSWNTDVLDEDDSMVVALDGWVVVVDGVEHRLNPLGIAVCLGCAEHWPCESVNADQLRWDFKS